MEMLGILEKKITALVELVQKFKADNNNLQEQLGAVQQQWTSLNAAHDELKEINAKQHEEIIQLKNALATFENSVLETKTSIDEFHQEKMLTKMLVDDLINSIDSLVENER